MLADTVEVEITGVEEELEANARAYLSIVDLGQEAEEAEQAEEAEAEQAEETGDDPDEEAAERDAGDREPSASPTVEITEARVRRLHRNAPAEIEAALRPFGYYDPDVSSTLEHVDDTWVARYEVDPGEPVRIDQVEIRVVGEGRDNESVRAALESIVLAPGDVLRHQQYEAAKQALFDAAYGAGFIDAAYERAEFLVRPQEREADVHLVLDTGPRYYFGDVVVDQDILNESFIANLVSIEPGEPFDTDRLIQLQIALGDSGYFNDVTIDVQRQEASNQRIPITVHTTPRPNQEFTVGAGYGTDTGPRLRLGVELRRLNRRGHSFRADLRVSAIENQLAAEYHVPVRNVATDYVSYRASIGQEEIGDFDTNAMSLGGSLNDVWRGLQRRVYLEARREEFNAGDAPSRTEDALFMGITLSSRRAGDTLVARQGYAWSADVRAGSEALGASTSFARMHLSANYVHPIGERMRLLVRGEYGAIDVDDLERLVPSQRFFAGGDRSVRGYEFESLGPVDAAGATIGGRYLMVGSVELEYLFFRDYGAAVFYDAGNAANDAIPDPKRAVGIGARWRSPVGMVRIDLAHPLDDPETDVRLHIGIGGGL